MSKDKYVFWFHYNKPESSRQNKPQISIKYRGNCYIVDNLQINVPTFGHIRPNEQPHFVVKGYAETIEIDENNIAYIN